MHTEKKMKLSDAVAIAESAERYSEAQLIDAIESLSCEPTWRECYEEINTLAEQLMIEEYDLETLANADLINYVVKYYHRLRSIYGKEVA